MTWRYSKQITARIKLKQVLLGKTTKKITN